MRNHFVKTLTRVGLLAAIAMFMAAGAQAQSLADTIRIKIPFDFAVGETKLPAGEYAVSRVEQSVGDTVLAVRSTNNVAVQLTIATTSFVPKRQATLIFHRYGDQYFLSQIWPMGATTGRVIRKSRTERNLEQKAIASNTTAETVSVTQ